MGADRPPQRDGHGVPDLLHDLRDRADEEIVVREPLDPGALVGGDGPVVDGVEVTALLRLNELGPDRDGSVSYTHLTLPTTLHECRSRWSPYH